MSLSGESNLDDVRTAYLALVQDVLLGKFSYDSGIMPVHLLGKGRLIERLLKARGYMVASTVPENSQGVEEGRIFPRSALTMIGRARLINIQECLEDTIRNRIPGDFIETGVWRGGGTIYARAVYKAWGEKARSVWVADSFAGLPSPNVADYPADADAPPFHMWAEQLAISLESVRSNFARLGLLDEQVRFVKGWFKDTLPGLDRKWSVIRLDGDLYESTTQALDALYPNLSLGGWVIVDDYYDVPVCKQAVDDYRARHGIEERIRQIDHTGVYWQRQPHE